VSKAIQKVRKLQALKVWADQTKAQRQAEQWRRYTEQQKSGDLLDYYCQLNPTWLRPTWLAPIANLFERAARGERVRAIVSAPPQHGKTELCKAGLAKILEAHPEKRNVYISFSAKRSELIAGQVQKLLAYRGVVTEGGKAHFETAQGGFLHSCGIDGGITGTPADGIIVLDDLIKNAKEARSATVRNSKMEDLRMSVLTRAHPGVSVLLIATRWDPKDPSGQLIEEGWEVVNLTAIAEENDILGREIGTALAPEIRPIDFLLAQKREILDGPFAAMYQGRPRPRGGTVFHEAHYYTALPTEFVAGFGVDLAYTAKTTADKSVCLEMLRVETGDPARPKFYVTACDIAQVEAPAFTLTLKARTTRRPGAKMLWRASGTERGSAQFIRQQGIPLLVENPPGDKFVSNTAVAAAWNDGRVLLPDPDTFPEASRWLIPLLASVGDFTGTGDEDDDIVDAMGNAHRLLTSKASTSGGGVSIGTAARPDRLV